MLRLLGNNGLASTGRMTASRSAFNLRPRSVELARWAGHSKWAKIARSKGANDIARSMVYNKAALAIGSAARAGGADVGSNLRLAAAVEKAKAANVPKDIIERAMATAANSAANVEEFTFEGLGPGSAAVIIETLTSSKRKTTIGLRSIFNKFDCEIGTNGSVSFMFESRGRCTVAVADDEKAHEALMEAAADADAFDVELSGENSAAEAGHAFVWCDPARAQSVRKSLEASKVAVVATETLRFPTTTVEVPEDAEAALADFISALEDHEDVQSVYHNASG